MAATAQRPYTRGNKSPALKSERPRARSGKKCEDGKRGKLDREREIQRVIRYAGLAPALSSSIYIFFRARLLLTILRDSCVCWVNLCETV